MMSKGYCKVSKCNGKLKRDPRDSSCVCMSCYAIHDWEENLLDQYGRVKDLNQNKDE